MFVESQTIIRLLPELILTALAAWIYLGGTFTRSRAWWTLFALAAYGVAGVALFQQDQQLWPSFLAGDLLRESGPLAVDFLGHSLRWLALLVGVLFTLMAARTASEELAAEFIGTLMLVVVGIMLVATANDLVLVFLGLELISIPTYVLLFLGRKDRAAAEATTKYFFLGIFASAILLYGFSFLYGIGGTTTLGGTRGIGDTIAYLAAGGADDAGRLALLPVALVLIFAGLGFKIAAVPFHFYAPDVYQGATNAGAGLLAVAPKIAGIVALVRLVAMAMPAASQFAWQLAVVLSIFTMTIGNVCALWQQNMRRLMAYSSVAHAGYMLIGLAVALAAGETGSGVPGVAAMLFYLSVYVVASAGTFAALTYLGAEGREVNDVDELSGVGRSQPWAGAVIALCMFSLAGIPPLVGFWGKFTLFTGAVGLAAGDVGGMRGLWFAVLAIAGAINAAVAAAYYLRVVGVLYFRTSPAERPVEPQGGWGALAAMTICGVLVAALGVLPSRIVFYSELAAKSAHVGPSTASTSREEVLKQAIGRLPAVEQPSDSALGAP